jgi:hypothetical protein
MSHITLVLCLWSTAGWFSVPGHAADAGDIRTHAEQSFERMKQPQGDNGMGKTSSTTRQVAETSPGAYPSDQYWIGSGQGDLSKGRAVCQRVSELSARTDLAKQIRVLVKEHMVDRVRERSGRESEQDIELTREEIVQEYLSGVKIVDRQIDETNNICTATAVMPKTPLTPKQPSNGESAPTMTR